MKIGEFNKFANKSLILGIVIILSSIRTFAADNSLFGINVEQYNSGEYKILLKIDKTVPIKKFVENDDNLILILTSTLPSESVEIVYDNAESLNNIIVQKKNKDKTLISIQGRNIKNAKIYTKLLSESGIKELNAERGFLNSLFFVTDKKLLISSFIGMLVFFVLMLISRPKEKRYRVKSANIMNKSAKSKKYAHINTLRNKNSMQSENIPSIGFRCNGSFKSAYISCPQNFTVNNGYSEEEQIRKAG